MVHRRGHLAGRIGLGTLASAFVGVGLFWAGASILAAAIAAWVASAALIPGTVWVLSRRECACPKAVQKERTCSQQSPIFNDAFQAPSFDPVYVAQVQTTKRPKPQGL